MEGQFKVCTNCGHMLVKRRDGAPVKELFDEDLHSKSGIIRLLGCAACGAAVADKYIEYEGVLILIDLVLQAKEAYRHVIFNGDYTRLILKMTLLTVICDGYIGWASLSSAGEFFEQEYQFYVLCAKAALGKFTVAFQSAIRMHFPFLFLSPAVLRVRGLTPGTGEDVRLRR